MGANLYYVKKFLQLEDRGQLIFQHWKKRKDGNSGFDGLTRRDGHVRTVVKEEAMADYSKLD